MLEDFALAKGWQLFQSIAELLHSDMDVMNEKNDFALVRKPSSAVDKAAPGAEELINTLG